MFFAHSLVFWEADGVMAADDNASNKGDVTGFPFGVEAAGFMSGNWKREGGAGDFEFLHSHLLSLRHITHENNE